MRWQLLVPVSVAILVACEPATVNAPGVDPPGAAEATVVDEGALVIDVQPGSEKNQVNLSSPSTQIAVAVFGAEGFVFDVELVDLTSAAFGPNGLARLHEFTLEGPGDHVRDLDEDGVPDLLMFHFDKLAAGFAVGPADACLTLVYDGVPLTMCELIEVVAQGGGPAR